MADVGNFTFADASRIVDAIAKKDREISRMIGSHDGYDREIRNLSDRYMGEIIDAALEDTPIEELAKVKKGVKVNVLKKAGINNVKQLKLMTSRALNEIPGIGGTSSRIIRDAYNIIVENVKDNTALKLSPDHKSFTATKLLEATYEAQKAKQASQEAEDLYNSTHDEIQKLIREAQAATSRQRWFFANDDAKERALSSLMRLKEYLDGDYGNCTEDLFKRKNEAQKRSHDEYWMHFSHNAARYYAYLDNVADEADKKDMARGRKNRRPRTVNSYAVLPKDLQVAVEAVDLNLKGLYCTLRPYQILGTKYIISQGSVLLGDEMGLGKTVQAIAAMVTMRNRGETHFLVVAPAAVLPNWCREIEKHSDLAPIQKIHGKDFDKRWKLWKEKGGVAVTTYETAIKLSLPEEFKIGMLIVDEAHYVKNPYAKRTKAVVRFRRATKRAVYMTGTALENRVLEMAYLIRMLQPKIGKEIQEKDEMSTSKSFRRIVAPVYFRRTKEEVLTELPEMIENEIWCSLEPEEAAVYCKSVLDHSFMDMRQVSWKVKKIDKSSKANMLRQICYEAMEQDRKVLIFSYFKNTLEQAAKMVEKAFKELEEADKEAKEQILAQIAAKKAAGEKVEEEEYPVDRIKPRLYGAITGDVNPAKRQEIIDEYSDYEGGAVLTAQIQAGGTGLNIQAASIIIICEPQIKPSIESQAIGRAYRMGQVNTVLVYRLLSDKTVDERIMNLLSYKQKLFDNFAGQSVSGEESMMISKAEFTKMMEEEEKRVRLLMEELEKRKQKEKAEIQ